MAQKFTVLRYSRLPLRSFPCSIVNCAHTDLHTGVHTGVHTDMETLLEFYL